DKQNELVENYSGGMKRRLEIARGLIHKPKVLFLDEPTLGLDAQTRRNIWEYIKKLNKENDITVILTTHYMEEADFLCNRVAIIDHGKIVALDKPSKLKDKIGGDVISLKIEQPPIMFTPYLKNLEWVKKINVFNGEITLNVDQGEIRIPELFHIAQKNNIKIRSVYLREPSLEDVFLHFTGKKMRDQEGNGRPFRMFMLRRKMRR
ncbi:MAG: ATP-binding protein DrrA1-3 family domain-containing protein, partial [Candidatus Odinarchaeia archaeon]